MPQLGPRIGKKNERTPDASRRQPAKERAGVIGNEANVTATSGSNGIKNLQHAVLERLTPDQPDVWIVRRLPEQVLAATKADLEPDLCDGLRK